MDNHRKNEEELEAEIVSLRRQVAELEAKLAGDIVPSRQAIDRPPRLPLETRVEFMGDFDVLQARGVNISEDGICFEVREDLPFEMRFALHGRVQTRRAHCVWVRRLPSGGCHLGLRFVPLKKAETEF